MEGVDAPRSSRRKTKTEIKLENVPFTMKYWYQGQTNACKFENKVQWITNTEIGHIQLEAIKSEVYGENPNSAWRRIRRSGLVESTVFPQAIQTLELILAIAQHYNKDTRKCMDTKGNVVVDLSLEMLALTFRIPQFEEVLQTIEEEVAKEFNGDVGKNRN